jgi:hypothetical protein
MDLGEFDVTANGQRFVFVADTEEPRPTDLKVVLNWTELLKKAPRQ